MGRTIVAGVFLAMLVAGVIGAIVAATAGQRQGEIGPPPDQLVQFDEQATAEFNRNVATRENVNQVVIVLAIALGLTGTIVVGVGRLEESSR